jgi:hypothetical protein
MSNTKLWRRIVSGNAIFPVAIQSAVFSGVSRRALAVQPNSSGSSFTADEHPRLFDNATEENFLAPLLYECERCQNSIAARLRARPRIDPAASQSAWNLKIPQAQPISHWPSRHAGGSELVGSAALG